MPFITLTSTAPKHDVVININHIVAYFPSNTSGTVVITTAMSTTGGSYTFAVQEDVMFIWNAIQDAINANS